MAEIIDLDFYRKFRLILPVRPGTLDKHQSSGVSRTPTKNYRRRQKENLKEKVTKEE